MGPSTQDEEVLRNLIRNGMNVARFNFSHGTHDYHREGMERVRRVAAELGANVAILLDTKGPEIRTGKIEGGATVQLEAGNEVVVTTDMSIVGNASKFALDYTDLPKEIGPGATILVDDGLIALTVLSVSGNEITCRVENDGELGEHKGVNIPNISLGIPSITERDRDDILFGCEVGVDCICASFVQDAKAIEDVRALCNANGGKDISVFAKIECGAAVANFDDILAKADGIMIARGDLGVEVPAAEVPHLQKSMIERCSRVYKPVITATQMLESMVVNPRPTRAEVADVANAIYDGTDCVMLSGETAKGAWPAEAVRMMADICIETEKYIHERQDFVPREGARNVNASIGFAAVQVADRVNAKALLAPTHSGRSARLISNFRPHEPIFAFSPKLTTVRKCCFYWGVEGFQTDEYDRMSQTFSNAIEVAKNNNLVGEGDFVVITAGDPNTCPKQDDYTTSTNILMVAQV